MLLPGCNRFDLTFRDTDCSHHRFVEHPETAGSNGAHSELLLARDPKLADDDNVQWRMECLGNFKAYWHTAARKRKNQHIGVIRISRQCLR